MGTDEQDNGGHTEFQIPITTTKGRQAVLKGKIRKITPEIQDSLVDLLAELLLADLVENPDRSVGGTRMEADASAPSNSPKRKRAQRDVQKGDEEKRL